MAIKGIEQPEILSIENGLRLRRFDRIDDLAITWYQDEETVYLVDGVRKPYTTDVLQRMYTYLNERGEVYYIEVLEQGAYLTIGDVTFWQYDMPLVIGNPSYRGKKIGQKVIEALVGRGKSLGYTSMYVNEIYDYNIASRKCYEHVGFRAYEKTEKGNRFVLQR